MRSYKEVARVDPNSRLRKLYDHVLRQSLKPLTIRLNDRYRAYRSDLLEPCVVRGLLALANSVSDDDGRSGIRWIRGWCCHRTLNSTFYVGSNPRNVPTGIHFLASSQKVARKEPGASCAGLFHG